MVTWKAQLHCVFPDTHESLETTVESVSTKGAGLHLKRMQVGSHHLVVSDNALSFELEVALPEGDFKAPVEICWYRWLDEERTFLVGVEFVGLSGEDRSTLKRAIDSLPRES